MYNQFSLSLSRLGGKKKVTAKSMAPVVVAGAVAASMARAVDAMTNRIDHEDH